jgi:hypothetical protein
MSAAPFRVTTTHLLLNAIVNVERLFIGSERTLNVEIEALRSLAPSHIQYSPRPDWVPISLAVKVIKGRRNR